MASTATQTTGTGDWKSTGCILCSINCGLQVQVADGHLVKIKGDKSNPRSQGYTCEKPSRLDHYQNHADRLATRHPDIVVDFSGLGGMWGLSVYHRHEIVELGWKLGAKLLGCGPSGEVSRLRIILLADVLTREIDQMIDVLDRIFLAVEARHEDD